MAQSEGFMSDIVGAVAGESIPAGDAVSTMQRDDELGGFTDVGGRHPMASDGRLIAPIPCVNWGGLRVSNP